MAEFIYNPNSGELYHYGVKGMKWGVRKAIGKQARAYAKGYYTNRKLSKKASKLDNKISKYAEKYGKSSNKVKSLSAKRAKIAKSMDSVQATMKKNVSGLSQKDIQQGKRDYMARKAAKAILATAAIAVTAYGGYKLGRGIVMANRRFAEGLTSGLAAVGRNVSPGAGRSSKGIGSGLRDAASSLSKANNRAKGDHALSMYKALTSSMDKMKNNNARTLEQWNDRSKARRYEELRNLGLTAESYLRDNGLYRKYPRPPR